MADNNTGNFGGISRDELRSLQEELRLFSQGAADAGKAMNQALRAGGADELVMNLTKAVNAGKSLAEVTKEDLKSQRTRNEIAEKYKKIKQAQNAVEANILVLKRKIELADKQAVESLGVALRRALDLSDNLDQAAKNAGKLADQSKKVAEAGAAFEKLGKALKEIPVLGGYLAKPFELAAEHAKKASAEGAGPLKANLLGALEAAKQLVFRLGPVVLIKALLEASSRLGEINKQLGLGMESARATAKRFEDYARNANDTRLTTDKLIKANGQLNDALGTSVEFSGKTLENFILTTEYMGISTAAAAKLETLARTTGQNTEDFAGSLAESVSQAGKANGLFMSTSTALEKVKNLSATTLLNLRRNPAAIGEAIIATEKLGVSFDQLRGIANSLLDFESSIANELEAEVLTGKELNLERARAAALRGDDLALTKELANQVGTLAEYEKMNVLQRESLAKAFGLSSDAMSEMLLKQELINTLGKEANDLSAEQAARIRQMVRDGDAKDERSALLRLQQEQDVTKRLQDILQKLKSTFVDIVQKYEKPISDFIKKIEDFFESGKFSDMVEKVQRIISEAIDIIKPIAKALASKGGIAAVLTLLALNKLRGATPFTPMYVSMSGMPGAGGTGAPGAGGPGGFGSMFYQRGGGLRYNSAGRLYNPANGQLVGANNARGLSVTGRAGTAAGGLTRMGGMGIGMVASLAGGAMMSSENENVRHAGSALSMGGTGAMIGSMIAPGIGTLIGGVLGAGVGLISSWKEAEAEEREEKKRKEEELAQKRREEEAFERAKKEREAELELQYKAQMTDFMRLQAERRLEVYMDANKISNALQIGTLGTQ